MSGIAVVAELLRADAPLTAVVPTARIKAGALPQGVQLPAILLTTISGVERNTLRPRLKKRQTDRVEVSVAAGTYAQQRQLIELARNACTDRIGDFGGVSAVVVHHDGIGPDQMDEKASIYAQTIDFRVSFNRPA